MHDPLDDVLSDCLDRLQRGETVALCLARYPDWATHLRPLLEAAASALAARPAPGLSSRETSRLRFQGAVRSRLAAQRSSKGETLFPSWARAWVGTAAALVLTIGFGSGAVLASSNAGPDSPLYPIKRATERARVALTPSEASRARLHLRWADRRGVEMAAMAQEGKADHVDRLRLDLVRELDLAHAEAGTSPETLSTAGAPSATGPEAGVRALGAGAAPPESSSPRPQESRPAEVQALDGAGSDARTFLRAVHDDGERTLARLILAQRKAPPPARQALGRALKAAQSRYGEPPALESGPYPFPPGIVVLRGVASYRGGTLWVGQRRVKLPADAVIHGRPRDGQVLVVGGLLQEDGSILALQVEAEGPAKGAPARVTLQGPLVPSPGGYLTIAGYRITLTPGQTMVQGEPTPGHWAMVEGRLVAPYVIAADRVRVLDGVPVPFEDTEE